METNGPDVGHNQRITASALSSLSIPGSSNLGGGVCVPRQQKSISLTCAANPMSVTARSGANQALLLSWQDVILVTHTED